MQRAAVAGLAALLACALLAAACGGEAPTPEQAPVAPEKLVREGSHEIAVLALEGLGTIRIELLPELAPESVAHFKKLVEEGLYDGTDGRGGTNYDITDEFSDMPHTRGVVSLANKGRHHTAGSQFFIVQQDTPQLDGMFTVFARVVEGIAVVDAVTELEIDKYGRYGPTDRPYPKDARITSIRIEPAEPS
ncbi:MAG: peptidylprolyl isomerase [Deltaproteobacteria bacterium]|nr:peptidylprolyl isomerase [Deltaproteobacteria bacterium]